MFCDKNRPARLFTKAAAFLAAAGVVAASIAAVDARPGPARIAYISLQRVATQSSAAQASAKKLQEFRDEKARQIGEKQKAVEAARLRVAQTGGMFQGSKREKARQDEQREVAELQRLQNEAQAALQKMQHEAQAEFQRDLVAVVGELVKQRGVDLVLNQDTSVIWSRGGMDWTSDVVNGVNARRPSK